MSPLLSQNAEVKLLKNAGICTIQLGYFLQKLPMHGDQDPIRLSAAQPLQEPHNQVSYKKLIEYRRFAPLALLTFINPRF